MTFVLDDELACSEFIIDASSKFNEEPKGYFFADDVDLKSLTKEDYSSSWVFNEGYCFDHDPHDSDRRKLKDVDCTALDCFNCATTASVCSWIAAPDNANFPD